jgi:hypothetical protein
MTRLFVLLAAVTLAFGLTACDAESVCDALCDAIDDCSSTDVSDTCKEAYAGTTGSALAAQEDACQSALDALDTTCADDDDSAN